MSAPQLTVFRNGPTAVSGDQLNTMMQTCDIAAQMRGLIGVPGLSLYTRGISAPGDGLGGPFYWNSTSAGPDDNLNVIVPSGAKLGAWCRLFAAGGSYTLNTIAALRAVTSASLSAATVYVLGYYTGADGGEGSFWNNTADTTTADNGGTIIVDASGRRWYRLTSGATINLLWFGAKRDQSANASPAILNCLTYAAGRLVYAPVGEYLMNTGIALTFPINLYGDGNGSGPGPAAQSNTDCTQFVAGSGAMVFFQSTSNYPSSFRDFQINGSNGGAGMTSGGGITISGPVGSTNANSAIEGVGFTNCSRPIRWIRAVAQRTVDCYFDTWINGAWSCETTTGIEGAGGFVAHNYFFGVSGDTTHGPAMFIQTGYIDVHDNLFAGGVGAIDVTISNYPAGAVNIHDNWIEEHTSYSIQLASTDGSATSLLRINNNEFSNVANTAPIAHILALDYAPGGTSTAWLAVSEIRGNVMRSVLATGSSFINLLTGQGWTVSENTIQNISTSSAAGIQITGVQAVGPNLIKDNAFVGTFNGAKYGLAANGSVRLIDSAGMSIAVLPTNAANGSEVFLTDAHYTSSSNPTVIAGGNGCAATRVNGAWLTWVP